MPSAIRFAFTSPAAQKSAAPSQAKPDEGSSFAGTLARELDQGTAQAAQQPAGDTSGADGQGAEPVPTEAALDAAEAWLALLQFNAASQPAAAPVPLPVDPNLADGATTPFIEGLAGQKLLQTAAGQDTAGTAAKTQEALQAKQAELAADGKGLPLSESLQQEDAPVETGSAPLPQFQPADASAAAQSPRQSESAAAAKPTHYVPEPVNGPRWGDAVAQRVALMLGRQEQQIEMQLNPPHLGPMEVRLSLAADNATVIFASQHANVREALAAATPKLTALLADQGIQLVNVQVASDSLNQHAGQQASAQQHSGGQRSQQFGVAVAQDAIQVEPYLLDNAMTLPVARGGVSFYA
ncbi:flagellar hook-length control protein FliK [Chitiniphilus purpureus]|uniref:Flagellar hook-length control protein FliK n=1 Tax=Chitiniphilus purpureus TaxID=2981137 RepID=A0ABY6DSW9_9NEIS|nr:flagellar hook-length control protein FliK [Chitiniphilus sp. CD1]UXY17117.1 flagellar hook-length control protein FliK [Chitiniphilus sp. CD1]